jgi:hypothetical protein
MEKRLKMMVVLLGWLKNFFNQNMANYRARTLTATSKRGRKGATNIGNCIEG